MEVEETMDLGSLKHADGAVKSKKRIGRGHGSGTGKTAGKGHKGQKARSGSGIRLGFEGGQMPLQRRVPKRGFFNLFKKEFQVVNVSDLEKINKNVVTPEDLYEAKLIRKKKVNVKILGNGDISKALEVNAHAFSQSAVEKLEKAGGKAIVL